MQKNHYQTSGFLALTLFASSAIALETPAGGGFDKRVKFINYNPAEVVELIGHYGFSTHIQFSQNEIVQQIAMGDDKAWTLAKLDNHLFIKPIEEEATTNMTVLTSRRVYNFEISAHWSQRGAHPIPNDMFFQVTFKYPEEEAMLAAKHQEQRELDDRLNEEITPDINSANWNYWAKGAIDVKPSDAYDDKRFTYLTFSHNAEMPAVYTVEQDGSESLVNTHIDENSPDTIVVHKVARKLVLRKGNAVACVFNKSYDRKGISSDNGTTIPGVSRRVIGQ